MCIETLTVDHIYAIHQQAIEEFGGTDGLFSNTQGKIESILNQQYPSFGYDKYPTIFDKAVMLMYFFAKNHCFQDGNKRVALYCLDIFLSINNYELMLDDNEAERLIIEVVTSQYKGYQLDNYLNTLSKYIEVHSVYSEFE